MRMKVFRLEVQMETCREVLQAHGKLIERLASTFEKSALSAEKATLAVDAVGPQVLRQDQAIIGIENCVIDEGSVLSSQLGAIGDTVSRLQEDLTMQRDYCASEGK